MRKAARLVSKTGCNQIRLLAPVPAEDREVTVKTRISRDPDTGEWIVTRPAFGFGSTTEVHTFPTHRDALHWVDHRIGRQGSLAGVAERTTPTSGKAIVATESTGQHYYYG